MDNSFESKQQSMLAQQMHMHATRATAKVCNFGRYPRIGIPTHGFIYTKQCVSLSLCCNFWIAFFKILKRSVFISECLPLHRIHKNLCFSQTQVVFKLYFKMKNKILSYTDKEPKVKLTDIWASVHYVSWPLEKVVLVTLLELGKEFVSCICLTWQYECQYSRFIIVNIGSDEKEMNFIINLIFRSVTFHNL